MNATQRLHSLGQSLWLDNITRTMLDDGTLERLIAQDSITGLTSNPSIFAAAIDAGDAYDQDIKAKSAAGGSVESVFVEIALDDLRRAADLFRPVFDATAQLDGWVSMEVSPLLAADTGGSIAAAQEIFGLAQRENLFVKIPGTPQGLAAIEESIISGIPINVTLLFSRDQYLAAANAYIRGIERRVEAGRDPRVTSVASLFVSRWDVAANPQLPVDLQTRLGIAVAQQTYRAYRELLTSARWRKLAALGARPQRLLWASTGTKDPGVVDTFYVDALAAPDTVNTIPEKTLLAVADHGRVGSVMAADGVAAAAAMAQLAGAGVDETVLAAQLQLEGVASFEASWHELMARIAAKRAVVGVP